jgi:hypothetical protein
MEMQEPALPNATALARQLVRQMERGWAESHALIERRYHRVGSGARWQATPLISPSLPERDVKSFILQRGVPKMYRIASIWCGFVVGRDGVSMTSAPPTRVLELFTGDPSAQSAPSGGRWRRIDWRPANYYWTGQRGATDDLAQAITYLHHDAPPGEYRVVTIRRMMLAKQVEGDAMKVGTAHACSNVDHWPMLR